MTGQSATVASLGVMVVLTALLGATATTLAQDAVPQKVRQQCCFETGGS